MKADEYDVLIRNPAEFMMDRLIPRLFSEMEKGSMRSHYAFLKAGWPWEMRNEILRKGATVRNTVWNTAGRRRGIHCSV